MKWCVIGAGGIADRRTIPAIASDKENELLAVMDRTPATAERVGKSTEYLIIRTKRRCLKITRATRCI